MLAKSLPSPRTPEEAMALRDAQVCVGWCVVAANVRAVQHVACRNRISLEPDLACGWFVLLVWRAS